MATSLEQFSKQCHDILTQEPGPPGREKVCRLLEEALKDPDFVAANLGEGTGSRDVLYQDTELGFCVLAHAYEGAAESKPHDHGPSWAIYGQAVGETEMTEWSLVENASPEKPGKVRAAKTYALKPGMAHVYNEGQLHSPKRAGPTRLIRIEGVNLDNITRLQYEAIP